MKRKESPEEFYRRKKMERRADNRRVIRMTALIMQLGITMLTAILLCGIPGRIIAVRTGHPFIFPLFLVLGILAGFRSCFQIIERFTGRLGVGRQQRAETKKGDAGNGVPATDSNNISAAEDKESLTPGGEEEDEDELDEDPWI